MGIIDRFIDKRVQDKLGPIVKDFQVRLDQQKAMSFASLSNYGIRQAVYSSLRFDITNSDTLYAIIRKRYMKEAAVPLLVYKKKSERKADFNKYLTLTKGSQSGASFQKSIQYRVKALDEVTLDNDLARLLQRPSRTMGADSFWQGVYYQYALGECFIRKNRGGSLKGKPIELELLPSKAVEVIPESINSVTVKEYRYSSGTGFVTIPKEDMIHWKSYNPDNPLRGFDPLQPLRKRLNQDEALTDQAMYGAQNMGSDGALAPKQIDTLTETQVSQVTETIDSRVNNVGKRKAISWLPTPYDYINFGRSADEMQILEQLGWTFERICHVFGVAPEIFMSDQTFANKEWAQKNWITNDVMPVVYSLRDALNLQLVPDFDTGLFIDSDFSALPEMQDDLKKQMEGLLMLFNIGGMNQEEVRAITGFDPTNNPLHKDFYIQSGYVPLSDMSMPSEPPPTKDYGDYSDTSKAWDESQHPRAPIGSSNGGEFISSGSVDLSNYISNEKDNEKLAKELSNKLKEVGFKIPGNISESNTDFGTSYYVNAIDNNGNNFKFRISDHSVSNIYRLTEEFHVDRLNIGQKIVEAEKIAFPERFNIVSKTVTYHNIVEINESNISAGDVSLGIIRISSKGNAIHRVRKVYNTTLNIKVRK